jgi:hypothetical protein
MKIIIDKLINVQIQSLILKGGNFQQAAKKCKEIIGDLKLNEDKVQETLNNINKTNHGENRIPNCIKYDLPGFCRLVTIQSNGILALIYLGTHDDVDKWLNNNKGYILGVERESNQVVNFLISESLSDPNKRIESNTDHSSGYLYSKLKNYWGNLESLIPSKIIINHFKELTSISEEDYILDCAQMIQNQELAELFFDTFISLKSGDIDKAKNRISYFNKQINLLSEVSNEQKESISSNDNYLVINDLEEEDLRILMSNKNWMEWMLFMHPSQRAVVDRDFSGSSRLLGVSGSGKTCIIVRRAVRLAKLYKNEKILILTLNKSLSRLISQMVNLLLESSKSMEFRNFIEVKSFWELCKEMIIEFSNEHNVHKILEDRTDLHQESIEEVWSEYYKCENNNSDAEIFFPLHQSLLSRKIYPQEYIKQELDWIRSFIPFEKRDDYLNVVRENRAIPLSKEDRDQVLNGLKGWEDKMMFVGVTDYLGLANQLFKYREKIIPRYRSILIDEIQDFGTLELELVRKMVEKNDNDLFLSGDIAQKVHNKHHKINSTGIVISPDSYITIKKNYRNSREILEASYSLFEKNIDETKYNSEDFKILNPEFANFSSPLPFLRLSDSLQMEFNFALNYLNGILEDNEKGCIAFCNYDIYDLEKICNSIGLPLLNGTDFSLSSHKIVISDLDQTKGFEFDRVVIVNASKKQFPSEHLPEEEKFREISKLYVAMTRAKKELIISYTKEYSEIFSDCLEYFTLDNWQDHLELDIPIHHIKPSRRYNSNLDEIYKMNGREFLYSTKSIGVSKDLQNKIVNLVKGFQISEGNKQVGWVNMDKLIQYVLYSNNRPHLSRLFGPNVYEELRVLSNKLIRFQI